MSQVDTQLQPNPMDTPSFLGIRRRSSRIRTTSVSRLPFMGWLLPSAQTPRAESYFNCPTESAPICR